MLETKFAFSLEYPTLFLSTLPEVDSVIEFDVGVLSVCSMFPSASLLSEPIAGTSQYEINRKDVILSDVFTNMEDETVIQKYNITDWAITETTLDECFLKVRFNLLTVCIDC